MASSGGFIPGLSVAQAGSVGLSQNLRKFRLESESRTPKPVDSKLVQLVDVLDRLCIAGFDG